MGQPLEKILSLSDIDGITDLISAYLKKTVVIEDEQFSLLAYSSFYIEQFDDANQQTIFSKRWPISILEKFMDEGIVDQLKMNPKPFRINRIKDIGLNQRIVVSAKHKDIILGYIWVQEIGQKLTDDELEFLYEVSFHIGKLLFQKNQLMIQKDVEKDHFYKKIIQELFQSENQIKWEAANIDVIIPEVFIVNVFTVAQVDKEIFDVLTEKVRLFANALRYPTHFFIDQLKIIVVIGSNSSGSNRLTEGANELTSTVLSQFKDQMVYAGVGGIYSSILQLSKSYKEALEVIQAAKFIGSPHQITFEYNKLGIFRYLEMISMHHNKTEYVNDQLLLLQKKDQDSQTNLLQTLEVYLLNNCRLKPTAEQLFTHTNTIKYRIKQITDLTSIDLDDFNMRCQLFIDIQLLKRKS